MYEPFSVMGMIAITHPPLLTTAKESERKQIQAVCPCYQLFLAIIVVGSDLNDI